MSRRLYIGERDGEAGFFLAPPGVDAKTAPLNQLKMSVTNRVAQFIMIGLTGTANTTVQLGLSRVPIVVLIGRQSIPSWVPGYPDNVPIRPSPWHQNLGPIYSTATVNGNGASMTVTGAVSKVHIVYRLPIT